MVSFTRTQKGDKKVINGIWAHSSLSKKKRFSPGWFFYFIPCLSISCNVTTNVIGILPTFSRREEIGEHIFLDTYEAIQWIYQNIYSHVAQRVKKCWNNKTKRTDSNLKRTKLKFSFQFECHGCNYGCKTKNGFEKY